MPEFGPAQVTIDGNLTLDDEDALVIELNGSDPLTQFDNFIVNGTVTLGLAIFPLSGTRTGTAGEVLVLIKNDDVDPISGIFQNYSEGSVVVVNNVPYVITYIYNAEGTTFGDGNDMAFVDITGAHYVFTTPPGATAGQLVNFTVSLLDGNNNPVTAYIGAVHITSSDPQAVLPPDAPLTNNGSGSFNITFKTSGPQTITATDTTTSSITGTSAAINVIHGPTTNFLVVAPASAIAGVAFEFTVTARDAFGNTATGFTGNVAFASTGSVTLPPNSTLTSGTRIFNATLRTVWQPHHHCNGHGQRGHKWHQQHHCRQPRGGQQLRRRIARDHHGGRRYERQHRRSRPVQQHGNELHRHSPLYEHRSPGRAPRRRHAGRRQRVI